jgi:hypothetical protein
MSATFYYRRNIDSVPDTIKRVMYKQAMIDAYPHVFSDDELNEIVDKKMNNGEPYEEELLYLRGAKAIHKFLIDEITDGVNTDEPIQVTIDVLKNLVERSETILNSGIADDGSLADTLAASLLLPIDDGFVFASDYNKRYVDTLKKIVEAFKPIIEHPEIYPDPIVYEGTW